MRVPPPEYGLSIIRRHPCGVLRNSCPAILLHNSFYLLMPFSEVVQKVGSLHHLLHIHLPGLTPYARALQVQSEHVRKHLDHKTLSEAEFHERYKQTPVPTLLTFETLPTYTCGRRQVGRLSVSDIALLRNDGKASFYEDLRGGETTYHGPGQLVAFLISTLVPRLGSTTDHVRLLEYAVIETCSRYGIKGFTTGDPGVWTSADDKIASVGVHLRQYVTSYGIGLNVATDLGWFDRIVACGLVGKRATSLEREGVTGVEVDEVADVLAGKIDARLSKV